MTDEHTHCWHNISITEEAYPHGTHVKPSDKPSTRKYTSVYRCCWCGEETDESPMAKETAAHMATMRADLEKLRNGIPDESPQPGITAQLDKLERRVHALEERTFEPGHIPEP